MRPTNGSLPQTFVHPARKQGLRGDASATKKKNVGEESSYEYYTDDSATKDAREGTKTRPAKASSSVACRAAPAPTASASVQQSTSATVLHAATLSEVGFVE